MKITKFRTVGIIYPWLSLECEVIDGDKKYYPNISVNNKGEPEEYCEDACWCYCKPMDRIGLDATGNKIDYDEDYKNSLVYLESAIYKQMYEFWNQNPVFSHDLAWKEFT